MLFYKLDILERQIGIVGTYNTMLRLEIVAE